ncbi:unnamed protein product [Ectocarpus sp. CCAP 1310/34]|nr:unnamed protein product [Ectocarpus sp. CCAP 1310/34]
MTGGLPQTAYAPPVLDPVDYPSRRRYGAVDDYTRRPHHRLVEESSSDHQPSRLPIARKDTVAVLCVFALLAGYYVANSREGDDGGNERSQLHVGRTARFVEEHAAAGGGALSSGESGQAQAFTALNFCHVRDGKPGQDYPFKLVEPRRETTLAASSTGRFHDGLGFLVSHSVLTNTFEYSWQAVNPKLTVPYWDFTIETSTSTETVYDPASPYTRTPLLNASWFGTADVDDGMVKDGRRAKSEIPMVRDNNPGGLEPDVYGKLQAPWNTNDRAYLTRGLGQLCQLNTNQLLPWPTCQTHYELTTGSHTFYDWVWNSMHAPDAPLHLWLGGTIDCAGTYEAIAELVGTLSRRRSRSWRFTTAGTCTATTCVASIPRALARMITGRFMQLLSSGQCGCHSYGLAQGSDYKIVIESMEYLEDLIGELDDTTQRKVVGALCTGMVNLGSHSQSSSTYDPLFWPTHPTMGRLYQFPVLTGSIDDFCWTDADINVTFADGTTVSEITSVYSDHCVGHHGSDVFPYFLLDTDTDGFEVANSLSYVSDKFEWSHCEADGFDFNDAWDDTEQSPPAARPFSHHQKAHGRLGLSLVYTQTFTRRWLSA